MGLHMDIFKVPTCCSCHVHGYAEVFPPYQKEPPKKSEEPFPGVDFVTTNDHKDELQDYRPGSLNKFISSFDSSLGNSRQNYSPSLATDIGLNQSLPFQDPLIRNRCSRSFQADRASIFLIEEWRSPRRYRGRMTNCRNSTRPTRERRATKGLWRRSTGIDSAGRRLEGSPPPTTRNTRRPPLTARSTVGESRSISSASFLPYRFFFPAC